MLKTSLYNKHRDLNAKVLPYAGYLMPINYSGGIQNEYNAVRNDVGVFDVSHMGQIFIKGENALKFIHKIAVNDASILRDGDAQYSAICNDSGGILDDIIVYKLTNNKFLLVVNASNCLKIFEWLNKYNKYDCDILNKTSDLSLIAVQGPNSRKIIEKILECPINLAFYKHKEYILNNKKIFISRTGYTGELGFELLGSADIINDFWDLLIENKVEPCGLAVRDVLRMEMKYCLYGNDINELISPIEASLSWIVKNSTNYIGSEIINNQKRNGVDKKLMCIKMIDKCIPRKGYKVFIDQDEVGIITSGTFSKSLNTGIAMAYINIEKINNKNICIEIRGKMNKGEIVKPPFIKDTSLHN